MPRAWNWRNRWRGRYVTAHGVDRLALVEPVPDQQRGHGSTFLIQAADGGQLGGVEGLDAVRLR
jgi:hypothetical protein